jgi:hypothetical protein
MWAVFLAIASPVVAEAEWQIYSQIQVRSEEGDWLKFDRYNKGPIRAWLVLKGKTEGAFRNGLPIYKIDSNPVRKVEGSKKVEKKEGYYVLWEIDDGKQPPGRLLSEFIEGKRAVFQYRMESDIIKETAFDLSGLPQSIRKLLD